MAQEMAQQRQYANENLLAELLPVTDNCNQALASICDTDDLECVARGVEMILDQLHGFMKRHNVSQVNPQGQPFDPDLHEAVEAVPTADVPENTVVEVVQPGYLLHDRLLRPARVKVAIAPDSSR